MDQYKVIPNEETLQYLVDRIGHQAAYYDTNLFALMSKAAPDHYQGGLWELREYPNGAFAFLLPEDDVVPSVKWSSQVSVCCSIETLSLVANLVVLNFLIESASNENDDVMAARFYDYYLALCDAVYGRMPSVVENNIVRDATPEEMAFAKAHPELPAISALLD